MVLMEDLLRCSYFSCSKKENKTSHQYLVGSKAKVEQTTRLAAPERVNTICENEENTTFHFVDTCATSSENNGTFVTGCESVACSNQ